MNSAYAFIPWTLGKHVACLGILFLALAYGLPAVGVNLPEAGPMMDPLGYAVTASAFLPFHLLYRRPVPKNPIQELTLNIFMLFYVVLAVAPFLILFYALVDAPLILLLTAIYAYLITHYTLSVDRVVHNSPTGRQVTYWQARLRD